MIPYTHCAQLNIQPAGIERVKLNICPLQGPIWAKTRLPLFSYKACYGPKRAYLCFPTRPDVGQNVPAFDFLQGPIWAKTCLPLFSYKARYGPKHACLCFPTRPDMGQNVHAFVFLQGPIWAENHVQTQWLKCGDSIMWVMWDTSSFYVEYWEANKQVYSHFSLFC